MKTDYLKAILYSKQRSDAFVAFKQSDRFKSLIIADLATFIKKLKYAYNLSLIKYSNFFEDLSSDLLSSLEYRYLIFFEKLTPSEFLELKQNFNPKESIFTEKLFHEELNPQKSISEFQTSALIMFLIERLKFGLEVYDAVYIAHSKLHTEFSSSIELENYTPSFIGPTLASYFFSEAGKSCEDPLKYIKIDQINRELISLFKEVAFVKDLLARSPSDFDPDFLVKEFFSDSFVSLYAKKESKAIVDLALSKINNLHEIAHLL